jgi:hypothetical protein
MIASKYKLLVLILGISFSFFQTSCSSSDEIFLGSHKTITYKINTSQFTKSLNLNEFAIDSICSLSLPDSLKLVQSSKLIEKNGKIYIMDSDIARSIYVFDHSGKFLKQIGSRGRAQYEYIGGPTDFFVDSDDNVHVFDKDGLKVLVFDRKGCILRVIHVDGHFPYNFGLTSNKRYMYSMMYGEVGSPALSLCDFNYNNEKKLLPISEEIQDGPSEHSFFLNDKRLSHIPILSDSVLVFNKDSIEKVVRFDFGGKFILDEMPEVKTEKVSSEKRSKYDGVWTLLTYQESDDLALMEYIFDAYTTYWLYNKHSKKIVNSHNIFEGANLWPRFYLKGNQLIAPIDKEQLLEFQEEYSKEENKELLEKSHPVFKDIVAGKIKAPFVMYFSIKK